MPIELKYELPLKFELEKEEDILIVLEDVKLVLSQYCPEEKDLSLKNILQIIEEKTKYPSGAKRIDFSLARNVVEWYRNRSEGGCKSCKEHVSFCVDAQDASSFWYCKIHDKSYEEVTKKCGYGIGSSPLIRKHYNNPCDSHIPKFGRRIETLIEKVEQEMGKH